MSPEQVFQRLRNRVKPSWVLIFSSTVLFGLAAHLYKLLNWLPNWDSLVFRYDSQDMLRFGRCFLSLACGISSYYDLPWLNGLLSLIYLGVSSVCICELLQLRKPVSLILTGGLLAAFPTVTSTLCYNYVADGYCLSMLLACLAALFLTRSGKKNWSLGVFCLFLSLGIYQAYVTVTILLLLVSLCNGLLFAGDTPKASLQKAVRFLCGGVCAGVLYLITMNLMLKVSGTQLSDYQGVSTANGFSATHFLRAAVKCVLRFVKFFGDPRYGVSLWSVSSLLMLLLLAVFLAAAIRRAALSVPALLLTLGYLASSVFGASILYFLNPGLDYHNLMTMGYCIFYLAFLSFYERLETAPARFVAFKNWSILLLSSVILFQCIVLANISSHKLQMAYERSYGLLVRIADRIEQLDDAETCSKLAVFGVLPDSEPYSAFFSLDMTGTTDGLLLRPDDPSVGQSVLTAALDDYAGMDYDFATRDEKEQLARLPQVQSMGVWPSRNSVAVIGDYIVIRLGDGIDIKD